MKQSYKRGGLVRDKVTSINIPIKTLEKLDLMKALTGLTRNELINSFCEKALEPQFRDQISEGEIYRKYKSGDEAKVLSVRMSSKLLSDLTDFAKSKRKIRETLIKEILENI